jgi:tripartite-type tricarboxylate transporter receptor subunit TctC
VRTLPSFLFGLTFAVAALAQGPADYPNKPVQLVVPFASGGPTDVIARQVGQKLGERLKHPVVIVNKPGAGGNLGSATVATAPADGYTLLLGTVSTHGINPSLYKNMPYDHRKDFVAISQLTIVPSVLVVNKDFPAKTVPELIDYLKKNPGKVFYATPGAGTSIHLASELLKMMSGTDMTHVPYKGSAPAMMDVIGGQVQLMFDNTVTAWPQVQAGKVRALGVTTKQRLKSAPDVPAIAEFLPGFEANAWHGIFAPAGTPQAIVDKLALEIQAVMKDPAIVEAFMKVDTIPVGITPREFRAFIDAETERWGAVVRKLGLTAE